MIILSVGMPRAGSGWHYNLVHDLVTAGGGQDARVIRKRFLLQPILTEVNCNIRALNNKRLIPVMIPSLLGNTFAIKAHGGPKPLAERLIASGHIKPTYIYRDPRAALLSAYEYGQRRLAKGKTNAFSHLANIDMAIDFMWEYIGIWESWMALDGVLKIRYEDMLSDFELQIAFLLDFLDLDAYDPAILAAIEPYRPGQTSKEQKGMHFHKGQPERFREVLTEVELARCAEVFGAALEKMGFEI